MVKVENESIINRGHAPTEALTESPLGAKRALADLVKLRGTSLNLVPVLEKFNPDHVHWHKLEGKYPFNPKPDLYAWLWKQGIVHFIPAKVSHRIIQPLFPKPNFNRETSERLYREYFKHYGITGNIQVNSEARSLLNYGYGVRIDPQDTRWPSKSVVKLFPEVDFRISFDYPSADEEFRQLVGDKIFILVNTNKVNRQIYKPHLLGYRPNILGKYDDLAIPVTIVTGVDYLNNVDIWLKGKGAADGVNGLFVYENSRSMIPVLLQSRGQAPDESTS